MYLNSRYGHVCVVVSISRFLWHRLLLAVAVFLAFGPSFLPCPLPLPQHHSTNRSHPSSLVVPSHPIRRYRPSLAVQKVWRTTDGQEDGATEELFPLEQRSIQRQRAPSVPTITAAAFHFRRCSSRHCAQLCSSPLRPSLQ